MNVPIKPITPAIIQSVCNSGTSMIKSKGLASENGDKGNMFPIILNQRWYTGGDYESANRTYFFVGAGVAIIDVVNTNTVIAGRTGLGAEFGEHIFGEVTLVYSDASAGARASSVGLYLGYRF